MVYMTGSVTKRSVTLVLLVALFASAVGWAFSMTATTQALDHELRVHGLSWSVTDEPQTLQANCCDDRAVDAGHLFFHAAEHSQLFFLGKLFSVIAFVGTTLFVPFVFKSHTELVPSSLFRPPRALLEV